MSLTTIKQYEPVAHSIQATVHMQTWRIEEYGHLAAGGIGPSRTRIQIKIDFHHEVQGYAQMDVFSNAGWQPVARMYGGEATELVYMTSWDRHREPGAREFFEPVINELAARAYALLSV